MPCRRTRTRTRRPRRTRRKRVREQSCLETKLTKNYHSHAGEGEGHTARHFAPRRKQGKRGKEPWRVMVLGVGVPQNVGPVVGTTVKGRRVKTAVERE
jgi:hypothetical protein